MFRKTVEKGSGLLLVQGTDSRIDSSIHMFFVFTDLAVFWIDSKMKVVDKVLARSWKPLYIPRTPARYVLECHPEEFPSFSIDDLARLGD